MNRRDFLAWASLPAWLGHSPRVEASAVPDRQWAFRLKEPAGLRRFGYPVHVRLPDQAGLGDVAEGRLRLVRQGRAIPAQFTRVGEETGKAAIELDFNASPGPFESEDYQIRVGDEPRLAEPTRRGIRARQAGSGIQVENAPYITYSLDSDLGGFVRSVKLPKLEFLAANSRGLFLAGKDRAPHFLDSGAEAGAGSPVEIIRSGPLAVGLRYRRRLALSGSPPIISTIELTFPSTKSWIETRWVLDDPQGQVERMGVDWTLQSDGPPLLWDCGAGSTVYGTLRAGEQMTFESGGDRSRPGAGAVPAWAIRHGPAGRLQDFAMARPGPDPAQAPEGWIHLIDSRRCTAVAVADFGRAGATGLDRFEVHASGQVVFERSFADKKSGPGVAKEPKKSLRFWAHFVTTPVQVGAVTSPQAMLAPLAVEWLEPVVR